MLHIGNLEDFFEYPNLKIFEKITWSMHVTWENHLAGIKYVLPDIWKLK